MPSRAIRVACAILIAIIIATGTSAASFTGKVIAVTDGDTIQVLRDKTPVKVRLHGIDCPESHQDFGAQAKKTTSELAFGKNVSVEVTDRDRYGRLVGVVTLSGGVNLNQELVKRGMAWWYREYAPHSKELPKLEAQAKAAKAGLWSQPHLTAPWEFRRGRSNKTAIAPESKKETVASHTAIVSDTVYVTPTGKCYHRADCRMIRKHARELKRTDAEKQGYRACKLCRP